MAGVCGGLAARAGIPQFVVRLIAVILVLLGAPAVFAYAAGWALLPDADGRIHAEDAIRGRFEPVMIAIGLLLVVSFVPFSPNYWWSAGSANPVLPVWLATTFAVVWSVLIVGAIVWLIIYLSVKSTTGATTTSVPASASAPAESTTDAAAPAPAPTSNWQATMRQNEARAEQNRLRRESYQAGQAERAAARRARRPGAGLTAIVLGIALISGAVAALVFSAGVWSQAALTLGIAVILGLIALGMVVLGFRGRESGALSGYAFLAVVALLVAGIVPANVQFVLIGSPTWFAIAPTEVDAHSGYALLVGQATLDLSGLDDGPMMFMRSNASQSINVWAGVGQTRIILPEHAPVLVDTTAVIGAVDYSGSRSGQDQQGILLHDARLFNSNNSLVPTVVHVRSFVGQVSIIIIISATTRGEVTP
ncbi:PspC domain-containing protein [Cryobacterium roopkundense]|uniref:PspC domain-containing protein n=1 Tax=Cryobacterium roopkundense TaxID=1001240 RepID=UPI002286FE43|nr:PspC domain-containing protein [Cryobacterium roopkundense]